MHCAARPNPPRVDPLYRQANFIEPFFIEPFFIEPFFIEPSKTSTIKDKHDSRRAPLKTSTTQNKHQNN